MSDTEEQDTQNNTELRDHLHQMEAKVRKLRESRNNHNDQANRFADQRNAIQGQYKEHKEKLDLAIAEVRAVRAEQNVHKERRDAVQAQIRDLIGVSKSRRGEQNNKNSASIEFNKLSSEVTSLERIFETKGGMSPKKEKETMEKIKQMRRKMAELEPLVAELQLIKVDISNRDEAINTLKAEADDAHKQFVACLEKAKEMSKELDELFEHRNFLKGEGDRFHKEFVACKEKANEVSNNCGTSADCNEITRPKTYLRRQQRGLG